MHRAPIASAPGRRRLRTAAAGAATSLCLVLAGCAVSDEPPAASGSSNTYLEGVLSTPSRTSLNPLQADIDFATQTVRNHRDAVALSEAVLAKDEIDAGVRTLAERTRDDHAGRIDALTGLLDGWGVEPPPEDEDAAETASYDPEQAAAESAKKATEDMRGGLLTDADRLAMESVTGDDAARVYLLQLHRLLQGAVTLAGNELQFGSDDAGKAMAQQITDGHAQGMQDLQGILSRAGAIGADEPATAPPAGFTGPIALEGVGADGSAPVDQTPSMLQSGRADQAQYWKTRPSATPSPSPSPADTARPATPSPSNG